MMEQAVARFLRGNPVRQGLYRDLPAPKRRPNTVVPPCLRYGSPVSNRIVRLLGELGDASRARCFREIQLPHLATENFIQALPGRRWSRHP